VIVEKTALVVIDMQNGFLNERSNHVVAPVVDLVEHWEHAGGDTLFTRYLNYPGSPYERLIRWSRLQSSPEIDIVDKLVPYAQRSRVVIDKTIYSLFNDEGTAIVRDGGWTDLIFCGVATDGCVLKSAVDAFELGYTPWVVRDACASHAGEAIHQAGLLLTGRFIGADQLIDVKTVIDHLLPTSA
jgi:nicotinamidase-related amidase